MYTIEILRQDYSRIRLKDITTHKTLELTLNDISFATRKFYDGEICNYDPRTGRISVVKSSTASKKFVGTITITKHMLYGMNRKKNQLYLCTPTNRKYPKCFVAINNKIKKPQLNSKYYVIIQYSIWQKILPHANVLKVLGEVGEEKIEYERLLWENGIFQRKKKYQYNNNGTTKKRINYNTKIYDLISFHNLMKLNYENNTYLNVISIDPKTCRDIDDALSYQFLPETNIHRVGIHIADVSFWVSYLNLDRYMKNQQFTVYGRDKNYNIFPNIFCEHLFSLKSNQHRLAISLFLDFKRKNNKYELENYEFKQSIIKVYKNLSYEKANNVLNNNNGKKKRKDKKISQILRKLHNISQNIFEQQYTTYDNDVANSHVIVEKYMILCNKLAAEFFIKKKQNFIIRSHEGTIFEEHEKTQINNIPNKKVRDFLYYYKSESAVYSMYKNVDENNIANNIGKYYHCGLKLNHYTHFTSPIRRIVDIHNHFIWKDIFNKTTKMRNNMNRINISKINEACDKNKIIHRKFDLIYNIYNSLKNGRTYSCYLIDFDNEILRLYFPEYNFVYSKRIIHRDLGSLIKIKNNNQQINIYNVSNGKSVRFTKYQKLKVLFTITNFDFKFTLSNFIL